MKPLPKAFEDFALKKADEHVVKIFGTDIDKKNFGYAVSSKNDFMAGFTTAYHLVVGVSKRLKAKQGDQC